LLQKQPRNNYVYNAAISFNHNNFHAQMNPVDYVNPFIGSMNSGNTFPGAVVPWGMVSVSPHNSPGSPPGYVNEKEYFYGFGHNHLSGTGCADLGKYCNCIKKSC
jgi:putative alpha-1,2-mannosidase